MKQDVFGAVLVAAAIIVSGCVTVDLEDCRRKAVNEQNARMQRYATSKMFGQAMPKLTNAQIADMLPSELTVAQLADIRRSVDAEFNRCRNEVVIPKWIEYKKESIVSEAGKLVAEAQASAATNGFAISRARFESAREIVWRQSGNAELDGVRFAEVNVPVRKGAVAYLEGTINVAEWPIIEKEMSGIAALALKDGQPTNGIVKLEAYQHIRTYSKVLDEKVAAIVGELGRLGVKKPACDKIVAETVKFMNEAANLSDMVDVMRTVEVKKEASKDVIIDESAYRKLLAEYKEALLVHDCTNENTTKMIDWLARQVASLIASMPKPEAPTRGPAVTQVLDKLGATAINRRIDKRRVELIAMLREEVKKADKLKSELARKLKSGDVKSARKQVLKLLTGEKEKKSGAMFEDADAQIREVALYELLAKINPALWAAIEKEIKEKTEEFGASGKCAEGIAWLEAYPPVRTYPEEIDDRFDDIKKAAVAFGVKQSKADAVMNDVRKIAAEVEYLACYTDEYKVDVIKGRKIPKKQIDAYEAQLKACRATLVENDCTPANADKLIALIRKRFEKDIAAIEADTHEKTLLLGSNAINVRLAKLKVKCAHALVGRCVSDLVASGKFAEARALLRDISLTDNGAFDAKVYASRLGAINTIVNPAQLTALQKGVDEKVDEFWKTGDFRAMKKWIDEYPYVHCTYPDIEKALSGVRKCMKELTIEDAAATNYIAKLDARILNMIESAKGGVAQEAPALDKEDLERALGILEKAIMAQYYDKDTALAVITSIRKDVLGMIKTDVASMTTSEMNSALRAYIEKVVREHAADAAAARPARFKMVSDEKKASEVQGVLLDAAQRGLVALSAGKKKDEILAEMAKGVTPSAVEWVSKLWKEMNAPKAAPTADDASKLSFDELLVILTDRQEYLEMLAKMDKEFDYDSQIAMAEDAIAKQLSKKPCGTCLRVNAILGEYARAMRLLKQAKTLTKDLGSAMVLGSVYLDQPTVFDRALELGADVNGVSPRDPLGRTALLLAVQLGRTAFIQRLVASGADVTVVDAEKSGILHYAVRRGNVSVLTAMLAKNDVNAVNAAGETALFDAARSNQPALVDAVIAAKADVMVCATNGMTAIDVACAEGSRDVLDSLADVGAAYGPKQLALAAKNGRLAVAQWLVSKGVDVNAPGVMEAAKDSKPVRNFLLHQGGIVPKNKKCERSDAGQVKSE